MKQDSRILMILILLSGVFLSISGKERISESESEYREILKDGREWVIEYHREDVSFNRYDIEHSCTEMDLIQIVGDTVVHGKTCKILEGKYSKDRGVVYEENEEFRKLFDLDNFKSFEENSYCIFSQYRRPQPDDFNYVITDIICVDDKSTRRRYTNDRFFDYLFFVDGIGVSSGQCVEHSRLSSDNGAVNNMVSRAGAGQWQGDVRPQRLLSGY